MGCGASSIMSSLNSYTAPYSPREELANAITHGVGFFVAIAALVYMINVMSVEHSLWQKTGIVVYGISLILMFLSSTLYHATSHPKTKQLFKRFDHCAIYLVIAGTYTPMLTISIQGTLPDTLLVIVWSMALLGVIFKAFYAGRFKRFSIISYLIMGWLSVLVIYQLYQVLTLVAFILLLLGGAAYSVGVIFYINKRIPFNHAIWHGFVFIGAISHCWMIAGYVLAGGGLSPVNP